MLLKRIGIVLLLAVMVFLPTQSAIVGASEGASTNASATPAPTEKVYDVELTVFCFDQCGGCGVDSPGCGDCQDITRYHGIIKGQLGNRLYDGTMLYRILNCRLEANDRAYDAFSAAYAIPQELYGYLPVVFIGDETQGVYLIGEPMMDYVGEYLDRYLTGEDVATIQADIDEARSRLIAEETAN
jgi:hypothetical protein